MFQPAQTSLPASHTPSTSPVASRPVRVSGPRLGRSLGLLAALLASAALTACGGADAAFDPELEAALAEADAVAAKSTSDGSNSVSPSITFSPATLAAGQSTTVTVTLGFSGSSDVYVGIGFPATALAGPRFVRIPSGRRSASFTLIANPYLAAATAATVTARTGLPNPSTFQSATVSISPGPLAGAAAPRVASVLLGAASVKNGTSVAGLVNLTGPAPAGGLAVQMALSNDFYKLSIDVPSVVVVPAGATFAPFTANTHLQTAGLTTLTDYVVANVYGSAFAGTALTVTR